MIRITTKTRVEIAAPLCVKELADALGKHPSFVYAMRGAGFVMKWNADLRCEAATPDQAKDWLRETGFRKR